MQPYPGHVPNHVTSAQTIAALGYQPTQLGQTPSQAPAQQPATLQQVPLGQQQLPPQVPYQQQHAPYLQGVPATSEYPSASSSQDYYAQSLPQPNVAGYSNFSAQPQMVYSRQPLLWQYTGSVAVTTGLLTSRIWGSTPKCLTSFCFFSDFLRGFTIYLKIPPNTWNV